MRVAWLGGLLMIGCLSPAHHPSEDTDGYAADTDEVPSMDETDAEDLPCSATILSLTPEDGAVHQPAAPLIEVRFDRALDGSTPWSLRLLGPDGEPVEGELTPTDDGGARFTPAEPLAVASTFTVDATVCDSARTHRFTTRGAPVPPEALIGRRFTVLPAAADWLAPAAASVFSPLLGSSPLVLELTDDRNGGVAAAVRPTVDDRLQPDPCGEPMHLGSLDLTDNPLVRLGPVDLNTRYDDSPLSLPDLMVGGLIVDDGERLIDLWATATLDVRPLDEQLAPLRICAVAGSLGEPCQPCPDGEVACLQIFVQLDEAVAEPEQAQPDDAGRACPPPH